MAEFYDPTFSTKSGGSGHRASTDAVYENTAENGGEKVCHGSGGMNPRRSA
jgi:hypothetical protein